MEREQRVFWEDGGMGEEEIPEFIVTSAFSDPRVNNQERQMLQSFWHAWCHLPLTCDLPPRSLSVPMHTTSLPPTSSLVCASFFASSPVACDGLGGSSSGRRSLQGPATTTAADDEGEKGLSSVQLLLYHANRQVELVPVSHCYVRAQVGQ